MCNNELLHKWGCLLLCHNKVSGIEHVLFFVYWCSWWLNRYSCWHFLFLQLTKNVKNVPKFGFKVDLRWTVRKLSILLLLMEEVAPDYPLSIKLKINMPYPKNIPNKSRQIKQPQQNLSSVNLHLVFRIKLQYCQNVVLCCHFPPSPLNI